jgi:multiple sugar transport system substrate-binding protein
MHRQIVTTLVAAITLLLSGSTLAQTINFWHTYSTGSGEEQTMLEQVIPRFEAQNPGIRVEATGFPYGDFRQKLLTAFAGGVVPDLVRMDIIWVPEFAEMGALEALDGYSGFAGLRESVFPGPLATNFWEGRYYGLPLDTNTQVFVYNADLVAEPPSTFEEFEAFAAAASDPGGNVYAYSVPGPWAWYFLPWIWSNGGAVTDPGITRATGYLNSPATIEAVEFLVELHNRGYLAPTIAQSGLGSWEGLGARSYLASQDGPWAHPSITGQYPDLDLRHAPMPAGKGGSVSVVGGEDIVMFADSRNKEAAWKFTQFLLSPWAQATMAPTGQIPVIKAALEDPFIVNHPYYGVYLEQLQTARPRTPHPAWTRIEDAIQTAFQLAVAGELSAKEALDRAAAQVDQLLN